MIHKTYILFINYDNNYLLRLFYVNFIHRYICIGKSFVDIFYLLIR